MRHRLVMRMLETGLRKKWSIGDSIQLPNLPSLPNLPPQFGIRVPTIAEITEKTKETISGVTESVKTMGGQLAETMKQYHIDGAEASLRLGMDFSAAGAKLGGLLNEKNEQIKEVLAKLVPNLNTHEDRETSISAAPVIVVDDLELKLTPGGTLREVELTKSPALGAHADPFIFKPDGGHELVRYWLYIQGTVLGVLGTTAAALSPAFPPGSDKPFKEIDGWLGNLRPSRIEFGDWEPSRFSIRLDADGELEDSK